MGIPVYLEAVFAGAFGAVLGSFLNVLIYRLPRESLSPNHPRRSLCPACGAAIPWFDNIPVLSYLRLSGKCRACGARISLRYPLVEAATALLFAVWILVREGGYDVEPTAGHWRLLYHLIHFYLFAVVIAVTFIDLDFQIIPDEITYSGMAAAPILCALVPGLQEYSFFFCPRFEPHLASFLSSLAGGAAGGGSLWLVGLLGKAALRRDALGLGDVKYMAFMGAMVGAEGVLLVFFLGCALGSVVGLPLRLVKGRREIPFGPFLSLGVVLVLFFRTEMLEFLTKTWPEWVRRLLG